MHKKYIFHSTNYEKELFFKKVMLLTNHSIDFKTIEKSVKAQFRSPLSGHFEVEIHISEDDFEKATSLLNNLDD